MIGRGFSQIKTDWKTAEAYSVLQEISAVTTMNCGANLIFKNLRITLCFSMVKCKIK